VKKMNEVSLAMELIRESKTAPAFPWMAVLRSHCVALADMDPDLVSAISVTTKLSGNSADEQEAVQRLSRHLADEFGFAVDVRLTDRALSVRFARAAVGSAAAEPSRNLREVVHG
jgi:hypothetical protein